MGRPLSKTASPQTVSAKLKRAGFTIIATRNMEGIRVSRAFLGSVGVEVDLDVPRQEERLANYVAEELATWDGYEIRRVGNRFYVSKAQ